MSTGGGRARAARGALWVLSALGLGSRALAGGASPYLPLNLSPEIERKIERVLILGDDAVLTRPVPIARVLQALPKACARDANLCAQVRHYLDRYFQSFAVTEASGELSAGSHSTLQTPNAHGERLDSPFDASVVASYRPFDHVLFTAGGLGYGGTDGRFTPDGTMASVGDEYVQLDAGYRDQWLSPLTDSSMLISTEAPAMPGFTVSNQLPIGPLGAEYQLSVSRMSYSDEIAWNGGYTAGDPQLATLHLGFAPLPGWSFAGNAVWQYGGGARPSGLGSLASSLFKPTVIGSTAATATDSRFANREVSLTSTYTFPAKTPFETYVEYAGRDTFHGELYRFHETALSAGIHIPELYKRFDLTIEGSEWQNFWYTDYVWQSGMVEDGSVIGNWGAAWRNFYNDAGARSGMVQLGFPVREYDEVDLQYRVLKNAGYAYLLQQGIAYPPGVGYPPVGYSLAEMATLEYDQLRNGYTRGLTLDVGRDEFAKGFVRLGVFVRLDGGNQGRANASDIDDEDEDQGNSGQQAASQRGLERFVDLGVSGGRIGLDLGGFSAASEAAPEQYQNVHSPHLGVGVRRAISTNNDLGVRIEVDNFNGMMLGLRIIDWRYRIGSHFAIGAFGGFARYNAPSPAQGYYYGGGVQWRRLFGGWDLSLDDRVFSTLQRDKLLPSDQAAAQNGDPVEWYDMNAPTLYLSHDF